MPAVTTVPTGAPCWVDLASSRVDDSRDFYAQLLGWTVDEPDPQLGGYAYFRKDGVPVGGSAPAMEAGDPETWTVYLATEDAQKTAEASEAAGGRVVVPPMQIGEHGTMGLVAGPGGPVGFWQAGTFQGTGLVMEPGTPCWYELHTASYDASLQFLRDAFGWETHAMDGPDGRYSTLVSDGQWYAGVADAASLPGGAAGWVVYFGVDDTDATLERATALGGTVLQEAQDTPHGRVAALADPLGARFFVVGVAADVPGTDAQPAGEAR